uniref:Ubiquitin carboxyl terminal hydrolase 5 n=1 Tax=Echinococcus granulosus TaxID=6210 RepID=A0A068WY56_ECHGR|nr:ubiquitin carboxyl terminal hydrolase 5 [Echinococcus granulosus]
MINNSTGASSRVVVDFAGTDSLVSVPKNGDEVFKDECVFSFAARASSRVVVDFAGTDSLVSVPKNGDEVFKDECVFSFAAPDDKNGLLICLRTFLGVGLDFMDGYVRRTENSVF